MSGDEVANLFQHASPNTRGYITRYSSTKKSFIISSLMPQTNGEPKLQHIILEVDEEKNRFSIEGLSKEFWAAGDILKYYEQNSISSGVGSIGIPFKSKETRLWSRMNNPEGRDEMAEDSNDDLGEETDEQRAEEPMAALNPQMQPQTAHHYQNQISELQQEVETLKQEIEKQKQQNIQRKSCSIQ